jgi:hypothetical protein
MRDADAMVMAGVVEKKKVATRTERYSKKTAVLEFLLNGNPENELPVFQRKNSIPPAGVWVIVVHTMRC